MDRIKEFGTALDVGQQVMVTKVVIKGDSHIEFQLGGGGFGTLFDDAGTQRVSSGTAGESARERALRDPIKTAPTPADTATEARQGTLTVLTRSYSAGGMKVTTSFVKDVLIDFAISPR
jgi:hypothetical protein